MIGQDVEPEFRIVLDIMLDFSLFEPLLLKLNESFPHTNIVIETQALGGGMELIQEERTDITSAENLRKYNNIEYFNFLTYEMIPVTSKKYFEKHQSLFETSLSLPQTTLILHKDTSRQQYAFGTVTGAFFIIVGTLEMKKQLLLAGMGWARIPLFAVESELESGELVRLDYPHIVNKYVTLAAIRKKDRFIGKVNQMFWEALKEISNSS